MKNLTSLACGILLFVNFNAAAHSHDEHTPHHASLFTGYTHLEGDESALTAGIDYEYRVNDLIGLGSVIEYANADIDAWTFLAVADIHLDNGLIFQVGPGIEHRHEHEVTVGRLGALYEFEVGKFTVSPQLHYDYHEHGEENAIVAGIAFGMAF